MKRLLAFLVLSSYLLVCPAQKPGDVVLLYDNDVHCSLDGYPVMAGMRDKLKERGCNVGVVSAGDFSFGGVMGTASKGSYIVRLMNAVGYDAVCPGNHEFDMGVGHMLHLDSTLNAHMVCCNFTGSTDAFPLVPYVMRQYGNRSVAFIGIATPATISCTSPVYFQDSEGRFAYSFNANRLAAAVQRWVDAARAAGADYVVLLSHLGDEEGEQTSTELIPQLTGVDVVMDGHDHHVIPQRVLKDKNGNDVLLTSTGAKFQHVGMLVIPADGSGLKTRLLKTDSLMRKGCVSPRVQDTLKAIESEYQSRGNSLVAQTPFMLEAEDPATGSRVCRLRETNLGDLVADAYRTLLGTDIGWVNAGALRQNFLPPQISRNGLMACMPFLNKVAIIEATGEDILNALETVVRGWPVEEGGFPQVSGLTFVLDSAVKSTVVIDSNGLFNRVAGDRRVRDVKVLVNGEYQPLDPQHRYTIGSTAYVLLMGGDAVTFPSRRRLPLPSWMSEDAVDIDLLEHYLKVTLEGQVPDIYQKPQGRIGFGQTKK